MSLGITSCSLVLVAAGFVVVTSPAVASAASLSPTSATWCTAQGAEVVGWTGTHPDLPICGIGPAYGGTWGWIDLPGPYGVMGTYYNATPGFQCVELAERFLAVDDGLAPVRADGSTVALNYHAAYPSTGLVVNGTSGAVGHPPEAGDVISFGSRDDFADSGDGHVAVVVGSEVNDATGDGLVDIAQENVGAGQYLRTLDLDAWRLVDPADPPDAEWQFPSAEWLTVPATAAFSGADSWVSVALISPTAPSVLPLSPLLVRVTRASSARTHASGRPRHRPRRRRRVRR